MLQHTVIFLDNSVLPTMWQQFGEGFLELRGGLVFQVWRGKALTIALSNTF